MMNFLAISLFLTSLVTAGVWSPSPDHYKQKQIQSEVIVKAGHRVVVVEYERGGDGNTKVLISPQEDKNFIQAAEEKLLKGATATKDALRDVKEKFKDAASVLPNVGQGLSDSYLDGHRTGGSRDLICDEFDKCEHKIGKTKDKVSEKAHEVSDKVHEVEEQAEEAVGEALGKAKDGMTQKTHETSEKVQEVGKEVKAKISEVSGKLRDCVPEKTKEMAKDIVAKARSWDVVDSPKRIGEDIEQNVSRKIENVKEPVKEKAKQAEEAVDNVKEEGKKNMNEILKRVRKAAYDFLSVSSERMGSVMGVFHLLGFSTAYGMCVWVTFVSSYVLATALPRQQFGMVQSKLYPVYFRAMAFCVGVALLGYSMSHRKRVLTSRVDMFHGCSLLASLLMVLINLLYLEPRATKVMFERMKIDKEEGRGLTGESRGGVAGLSMRSSSATTERSEGEITERPNTVGLNEKLKKLNTQSSFVNVLILMVLTWHLVYLGQCLQVSC